MLITSAQNPLIKHLIKLGESARYRRECGEVVLDGVHLLDACLQAGQIPSKVFLAESWADHPEIQRLIPTVAERIIHVSDAAFGKATDLKTSNGVLALYSPVQNLLSSEKPMRSIWLDDVQDPGNVGSILRTAASAGIDAAYLSAACADAWSPRVLRAGMGAHFLMQIHPQTDLMQLSQQFRGDLLATSLEQSTSLYQVEYREPVAWIFGNEGEGVKAELQQRATHRVYIPMPGGAESLNVAAAAAVCLFEDVRRRQLEP